VSYQRKMSHEILWPTGGPTERADESNLKWTRQQHMANILEAGHLFSFMADVKIA
jgi:hypothetical protein